MKISNQDSFISFKRKDFGWGYEIGVIDKNKVDRIVALSNFPMVIKYYDSKSKNPLLLSEISISFDEVKLLSSNSAVAQTLTKDEDNRIWKIETKFTVNQRCFDVNVLITLQRGSFANVVIHQPLSILSLIKDSYIFFPGAVYDSNKADKAKRVPYCPRLDLDEIKTVVPSGPVIVADIPRLDKYTNYSFDLQSTDMSTPAFGILNERENTGFFYATSQSSRLGNMGFKYLQDPSSNQHEISITLPVLRARRYRLSRWESSPDTPARFKAGDSVCYCLRIMPVYCSDLPEFFERFLDLRKLYRNGQSIKSTLPMSAAYKLIEDKYNKLNWREDLGIYTCGIGEDESNVLQMGWIGGLVEGYPLLVGGRKKTKERTIRMLNFILDNGMSPKGLFYGLFNGKEWKPKKFEDKEDYIWSLIRRNADTCQMALRLYNWMASKEEYLYLREKLEGRIVQSLRAQYELWKKYGQFGYWVYPNNGKIIWGPGSGGALCIASLAWGGKLFKKSEYSLCAQDAAHKYYAEYILKGVTFGGAGDALMAPEQESNYTLLESFMHLYELTKKKIFLKYARDTANLFTTWVLSYNASFPPNTLHNRLGIEPMGTIIANVQNRCGTIGICTDSGSAFLRLYEATDDDFYLEILSDITRTIPQFTCRYKGQMGDMEPGMITEDTNFGDSLAEAGEIYEGSSWSELALMFSYLDIPGLYVEPKKRRVTTIDHVSAEYKPEINKLFLKNLTDYDCRLRIRVRGMAKGSLVSLKRGESTTLDLGCSRENP